MIKTKRRTNTKSHEREREVFCFPLLIELAVRGDAPDRRFGKREKSDDLMEVRENVTSFFCFTKEQQAKLLPSGAHGQLYQEIHRARHFLVLDGYMHRDRWDIADRGLEALRAYIHGLLAHEATSKELDSLMESQGSNGEQCLCFLRSMPDDALRRALDSAVTRSELFLECVKRVPIDEFRSHLAFMWQDVRDLVSRDLYQRHGQAIRWL